MNRSIRLDASESLWFNRQLESIDSRVFQKKYAALKARQLVPTVPGIPDWASEYTFREVEHFGEAQFLAPGASDYPLADAKGDETTKLIKPFAAGYQFNVMEIRKAIAQGMDLRTEKAAAARRMIEQKMDKVLSIGDANYNLEGLLTLSDAKSYTLSTKAAGGLTWGTIGAPNATFGEVVQDLMGIAAARVDATEEVFDRFVIALPVAQYTYAAQLRDATNGGTLTPMQFAMANSPFIEAIVPWNRCKGAGAGGVNRMVCYTRDEEVLGAIIPTELQTLETEYANLAYKVPMIASTGGVVLRYPDAIAYADGL